MKDATSLFSALLLALIFVAMNERNVVRGDEAQTQSLTDLYLATNGPRWEFHSNWLDGDSCENDWYGVKCDDNETNVLELSLRKNRLDGTIPSSFGTNLVYLRSLDLSYNTLSGTIPSSLGEDLVDLENLQFSSNKLSGNIPTSFLSLEYLQGFSLGNNSLTGTIPEFPVSESLLSFDFGGNSLEGTIPSSVVQNLPNLQSVGLSFNRIQGTISDGFGTLSNLNSLFFDNNLLNGTIPQFTALTTLRNLNLYKNQLTGTIPNDFNNLHQLLLQHNFLTGNAPEVKGSSQLSFLNISFNNLNGTIPDYGIWMQNIFELDLNDNSLTGSIPPTHLFVDILYLQRNQLTGKIPEWVCGSEFDLSDNNFNCQDRPHCCHYNECANCSGPTIPWWGWTLIGLGGLLFVGGLVFLIFAYQKRIGPFQQDSEYVALN
mmetsp:Transcript_20677/g.28547  ORF Transcript_20677/g.28547 Transcript_20677/m.28547 type:complete len:430 (-) Transcript_20677:43-1332(-)|eukprot:CAMPEP_0201487756 /NCGR_PEP_ID=MMETSP0151_2-20130828/15211_1 /ASSEMBLY_ACC=CAM_ASM_000257 /TAXON_ID=200890 /ORGANISM="Paramoeba atlantica, Strain 621/1 / CCAP 1560/9" /LENGTH=429 /DNA_ID=CAMNT_0047872901 /DNA_START=145 /DNA_END=1434 /DNA_ORIENTATION=-